MFKLVVLCAFFAAAAAVPQIPVLGPFTHYSYLEPASTSITKQDSSVIHPSPLFYQAPYNFGYSHLIKKRSAQIPLAYSSPDAYYPSFPNFYSTYNKPLVYNAPFQPAHVATVSPALHLIKKRSAPLIPTTYYAPNSYATAYSAPLLSTTYTATAPIYSAARLTAEPLVYTHLIKKRSVPLLTTYTAPTSFSQQSRFDLKTTHYPYDVTPYASPLFYSTPIAYSKLYK